MKKKLNKRAIWQLRKIVEVYLLRELREYEKAYRKKRTTKTPDPRDDIGQRRQHGKDGDYSRSSTRIR